MLTLMPLSVIGRVTKVLIGSAAVSLAATLIPAALAVYGVISIPAARLLLISAGIVLIAGITTSDYLCAKSWKHVCGVGFLSTIVIGGSLFWLDGWALRKKAEIDAHAAPPKTIPPSPAVVVDSPTTLRPQSKSKPQASQRAETGGGHIIQQQGQNNIAQIGNYNTAVINNYVPEANLSSWTQESGKMLDGKPTVVVKFSVDHTLDMPAFAAECDRPCKAFGYAAMPIIQAYFLGSANRKIAGMVLNAPRPLGAGVPVSLQIVSEDDVPPRILQFGIVPPERVPPQPQ